MKKRQKWVRLAVLNMFVVVFCCLFLTSVVCAESPSQVIKARYSGWAPPPSLVGKIENHFFEVLKDKVGDRLQVDVFQGGTLYKYEEVLIPLKTGAVEIISLTNFTLFQWVPEFKTTILTGAWDIHELNAYQHSADFERAWQKILKVSNSIPFGFHPAGTFYLFSSQPVKSIDGFEGYRLESGNFEMIDIVKTLGGSGGSVAVYDIYTALQQGMYDGAIGTPSVALGFGWPEFVKHVSTNAWASNVNWILVNKDFWDSLPKDIQEAFKEAAEETTKWSLAFTPEEEKRQLEVMEKKWGIQYFSIEDWHKIVQTAKKEVWPKIRKEVKPDFFDAAMKHAGLAD
jgi:TRAP-type C4-dicarboxylate transport system substrate-binding protein